MFTKCIYFTYHVSVRNTKEKNWGSCFSIDVNVLPPSCECSLQHHVELLGPHLKWLTSLPLEVLSDPTSCLISLFLWNIPPHTNIATLHFSPFLPLPLHFLILLETSTTHVPISNHRPPRRRETLRSSAWCTVTISGKVWLKEDLVTWSVNRMLTFSYRRVRSVDPAPFLISPSPFSVHNTINTCFYPDERYQNQSLICQWQQMKLSFYCLPSKWPWQFLLSCLVYWK